MLCRSAHIEALEVKVQNLEREISKLRAQEVMRSAWPQIGEQQSLCARPDVVVVQGQCGTIAEDELEESPLCQSSSHVLPHGFARALIHVSRAVACSVCMLSPQRSPLVATDLPCSTRLCAHHRSLYPID